MINREDSRTRPEDFTVPPEWIPFPSKIAFGLHEAKRAFGDHIEVNNSGFSDVFRLGSVIGGCNVIAIRNCNELESNFSRLVGELHCKPVVPIGLLPPADFDGSSDQDDMWLTIKEWLDKQNKGSVVYIAFGSESELSQPELHELALGLELSGLPFFWALRKRENSVKLPDGFEERVKGRGTVWTDQGLIARFFGEKMVGIEITKDEKDGSLRRESVAESLRLIMVEKEGRGYRDKAKEMKKLIADKDMHDRYVDHFVEFMQNHRVA
ncbi:hypothetical protein GH714_037770 [Hevea brasiliensis]|uniref:Uncharacterized protein n=1 Tax=Hevea brasiliensis TaxID=3981 RepID=A0A6A6LM93_HEVBR|nr:hypothetical protein GH714_037770 [Hevea brasiliensis]